MSRTTTIAATVLTLAAALATPTAHAASASVGAVRHREATAFEVTARITHRRDLVVAGGSVTIRGHVSPDAAGEDVVLQQRQGSQRRWRPSGTGTVRRNGTFVLTDRVTTGGHRSYRVLKRASDGNARGVSDTMYVAVWAYEPLTSRPAGATSGVTLGAATYVGTDLYGSSIVLTTPGTSGYVEYTLGDECLTLAATDALTDDSETGAYGSASITVDGVQAMHHDLGTGLIGSYNVAVVDAFRIRIDLQASASPAGRSVVASPYVMCLDD
jgi:hypothetical protein